MRITFNGGLVTARPRGLLANGDLQSASGIFYKAGDPVTAYKIGGRPAGRSVTGGSSLVKGLALCQFDSGTDQLIAYAGTTLYKANTTPATGSFSAFTGLGASLNASATKLTTCHAYDKHMIGNGYDANRVLLSGGSLRLMGMFPPAQAPTVTVGVRAGGALSASHPDGQSSSGTAWFNPTLVADTDYNTYAAAYGAAGTSFIETWTWSTPSSTTATRRLAVTWGLGLAGQENIPVETGGTDTGSVYTFLLEYSENSGSTWTTIASRTAAHDTISTKTSSVNLTNGLNTTAVRFRATFTMVSGQTQPVMKIRDVSILDGGTAAFNTTVGMYYAFSEWDQSNRLESQASDPSSLVTFTGGTNNSATVTLPTTPINTGTTHWRIYRTHDGGVVKKDLGLIAEIPYTQTTFIDDFISFPKDTPGTPLYALVQIEDAGGTLYYDRDSPPPAFQHMTFWRGSIVGVQRDQPRQIAYSYGGMPESWPKCYVMDNLPMAEHDAVLGTASAGDSLIIIGQFGIYAIDELPRSSQGVFGSGFRTLRGLPGCVSQYAFCSYQINGESRVAWVSPTGVFTTNGTTSEHISRNINWIGASGLGTSTNSTIVLHWDSQIQCLVLAYDANGDGINDRFFYIHMAPEHQREDGQPRWTGLHFGLIQSMASGYVGGTYFRWSGHGSDGNVYQENSGTSDASSAGGSTSIAMTFQTARIFQENASEMPVVKGVLYHGAFGAGTTGTIAWSYGRDLQGTADSLSTSVTLVSHQTDEFSILRNAQWHSFQFTNSDSVQSSVSYLDLVILPRRTGPGTGW